MLDGPKLAERLAHRLRLYSALESQDLAAIARLPTVERRYEAREILLREGDRLQSGGLLLSGFVYRQKIVHDGGRQIVRLYMPGECFDMQSVRLRADHEVWALTKARVACVAVSDLATICTERPAVAAALWRETLIDASIMRERIASLGRRDARARVAHLLCELALRAEMAGFGTRDTFELPMTQGQLADMLGLTAVHVQRTLGALSGDGIVTRTKRLVCVHDWTALAMVGEFTQGYLHLEHGRASNAVR